MDKNLNPQQPEHTDTAAAINAIQFDVDALDGSIRESGLDEEFTDLGSDVYRKLAADAMIVCTLAFQAETEEQFDEAISVMTAIEGATESAFFAGFLEHLRSGLEQELGVFLKQEGFQDRLFARMQRARKALALAH
jgi:hypothetical protein